MNKAWSYTWGTPYWFNVALTTNKHLVYIDAGEARVVDRDRCFATRLEALEAMCNEAVKEYHKVLSRIMDIQEKILKERTEPTPFPS